MPEPTRQDEEFWLIGTIVAPHGLQGTLRVQPHTDFPERFLKLKVCHLFWPDGRTATAPVKRVKLAPRGVLLNLTTVTTREQADDLRGVQLKVPQHERWPLPEGLYYAGDLIGCRALDEHNTLIGEICAVTRHAQDVLHVNTSNGEVLVPFVEEWVGTVDLETRTVVFKRFERLSSPESPPDRP